MNPTPETPKPAPETKPATVRDALAAVLADLPGVRALPTPDDLEARLAYPATETGEKPYPDRFAVLRRVLDDHGLACGDLRLFRAVAGDVVCLYGLRLKTPAPAPRARKGGGRP